MNAKQKRKENLRGRDRDWFKKRLPLSMMEENEIHHEWDSEENRCYLVSHIEHVRIETNHRERNRPTNRKIHRDIFSVTGYKLLFSSNIEK